MTAAEKLKAIEESKAKEITPITVVPSPKRKFTLESLLSECITHLTPILPETHICTVNGSNFMTNGEIAFISGLPKVGKSTVVSFVIATALMKDIPDTLDTLKIRTNYTEKNIIYIDTEQSKSGTAATLKRVLKLANVTECPTNLKYFNVRQYNIDERIEIFKTICDDLPNIAFIVVDGITDFLTGVNDELGSNAAIEMLMHYSSLLDIPILSIIHETYGGKLRGQFGSQGERKCSGAITIKKHKEHRCFSIEPKFIRYGADFEDIYYQYNTESGNIESLDFEAVQAVKKSEAAKDEKASELKAMLEKCYDSNSEGFSKQDIVKRITMHQISKAGATESAKRALSHRNLTKCIDLGLIEVRDELHYYNSINKDLFTQNEEEENGNTV